MMLSGRSLMEISLLKCSSLTRSGYSKHISVRNWISIGSVFLLAYSFWTTSCQLVWKKVVVVGPLHDGLLFDRHGLRVSVESTSSLDDTACKFTQPDGSPLAVSPRQGARSTETLNPCRSESKPSWRGHTTTSSKPAGRTWCRTSTPARRRIRWKSSS